MHALGQRARQLPCLMGAAIMARAGLAIVMCKPITSECLAMQEAARVCRCVVCPQSGDPLHIFSVYGWDGSDAKSERMYNTSTLMAAIAIGLAAIGRCKCLIMGDFNCGIQNVDVMQVIMREHKMF